MTSKVHEYKHCVDCGAGFSARGYPRDVAAWVYCLTCGRRHADAPHAVTITERDIQGNVLGVSTFNAQ